MMKHWGKILLAILGVGTAFALNVGATTTTIPARNINGDYFSPAVTIPAGNQVTLTATMSDATYHNTAKSFSMTFQYSRDNGVTWRDSIKCGWKGVVETLTAPDGTIDPRPSCSTDLQNLEGQKMRLYVNSPSLINMGATITIK